MADQSGVIPPTSPIDRISLPFGQQEPARGTTQIDLANNLNAAATDSVATLTSVGSTGITTVSGIARDGAGGEHHLTITGANATQSTLTGSSTAGVADMTAATAIPSASGGGMVGGTYYYTVTAIGAAGETLGNETAGVPVSGPNGSVRLTWSPMAGAQSYNIYRSTIPDNYAFPPNGLIGNISGNSFTDTGAAGAGDVPAANTAMAYLTGAEVLGTDLGVTLFDNLSITVDGSAPISMTGLDATSTVSDLISALNQIEGVTADIDNGQVRLTRDYAGDGAFYNVVTSAAALGDIVNIVFGRGAGSTFSASSGTASTLVAADVFTPTNGTAQPPVTLGVIPDPDSGLVVGIDGLGGGGVVIDAPAGLK
ncbi:MAG: hypothetical protein GY778_15870, partial [bacterium]|nr:hypothetical protein [bacterium]